LLKPSACECNVCRYDAVDSEEMAVRGAWWRVESLEGSAKPSTYHNQWDLAGLVFFSDDACKVGLYNLSPDDP
jgi:hypothetical protein